MLEGGLWLVVAVIAAVACGVMLRVSWTILRGGTGAVLDAYQRGESLDSWLDPSKVREPATPGLDVRYGMSVRVDRELGRHLVEERASSPEL